MAKSNKDLEEKSAELRVIRSELKELNVEISKTFSSTTNFYDNSAKEVQESLKKCLEILGTAHKYKNTSEIKTVKMPSKLIYFSPSLGCNFFPNGKTGKLDEESPRRRIHTSIYKLIECEVFYFEIFRCFKSMKSEDVAKL